MARDPYIHKLDDAPDAPFPDPELCEHPEGLLAWGGDLDPQRLLRAYAMGIFPWYEPGSPILWWSPDPRLIFRPGQVHVSRSLRKTLRQMDWKLTLDEDFMAVVQGCAAPRANERGTWITSSMQGAYATLHDLGHAHSVEVWSGSELVGGLYGVSLGHVFFAESKFHRKTNASKVALVSLMGMLKACGFALMDCQVANPHLLRLGAQFIPRVEFRHAIIQGLKGPALHPSMQPGSWQSYSSLLCDHGLCKT